MKHCLLKSVSVLTAILFCTTLSAQIIYVNTNASAGGNGTSWNSAYRDLQPALIDVQNSVGDEIWVAQGSYFIIGTSTTSFVIPSGASLYGGFVGNETTRASRDWANNTTILEGNTNFHTLVYFLNSSSTTILDGFTLRNAFADGIDTRNQSGSAIFIDVTSGQVSDPQISNCTISNNYAVANGGAVYIDGSISGSSAPIFTNCTFDNNESNSDGGAVYAAGISGGTCTPTFSKCTFINNKSVGSGGAIFCHGGDGNATATINKCNFDSNIAEGNGGAIYSLGTGTGSANHSILNSRFYDNHGFAAGAIYNNGGNGGDCSPSIVNCTFYLNEATGGAGTGGAIYNNGENGGNSSTFVSNCVIYGNIGPFDSQVFRNIDGTPTIQYSIVDAADCNALNSGAGSNVTCGSGMVFNIDPLFENTGTGDLRLQTSSPAIDTGNDGDNLEAEDLDCNQRKVNAIDMGAYEVPDQSLPVELALFKAFLDEQKVTLFWVTLSEIDNAYFTVERSSDGVQFEELFTIPGAGTTSIAINYKEYDYHPRSGANYYRIKNTSYDGAIEYSPIRVVNMGSEKINVYPNPVEQHLTVTFSDFKEDEASFAIYNAYGKQVYQGKTRVENEVSFISLPEIGSFVPGAYILKVYTSKNGSYSHRFLKIRD